MTAPRSRTTASARETAGVTGADAPVREAGGRSAPALRGIRGWPASERPRERLLAQGPGHLSDAELIAVLLRTGTKGRDAVALAREMLAACNGSLPALSRLLPAELARRKGVGPAKAAAIVAALELARRMVVEPEGTKPRFRSSADAARHFMVRYRGLKRESFRVALLDSGHRLIAEKTVTVGTLNLALVHPRDVFRHAVAESAAAVVLVHNHPSGDPAPSEEDLRLTRQLLKAGDDLGIPVVDHVIVAGSRWYSFADSRRMER